MTINRTKQTLYASIWLASLLHVSYRERERESVWVGKKKFWKVLTCALCEVWISVHQSWVTTGWVPSGLCSELFGILG